MKALKEIYKKRKKQLLPVILFLAAVVIFLRIILPQLSDIGEARSEIGKKEATVTAKEKNLQFLSTIPDEIIENDFRIATIAVPTQKDIILIYTELIDASLRAGVTLGGFSVQLGGVYTKDEGEAAAEQRSQIGVPFVNILVNVAGPSLSVKNFADELYKSIPLVEIVKVNLLDNEAKYDVNFYYKPISLRPQGGSTEILVPLTKEEDDLLKELETWRGVSQ